MEWSLYVFGDQNNLYKSSRAVLAHDGKQNTRRVRILSSQTTVGQNERFRSVSRGRHSQVWSAVTHKQKSSHDITSARTSRHLCGSVGYTRALRRGETKPKQTKKVK